MKPFVRAVRNCTGSWHRAHRFRGAVLRLAVALILGAVLWSVPLPYYLITPGDAYDAAGLVRVHDAPAGPRGRFLVLTVSVRRTNLFWWLYGHLEQERARLESEPEFLGPYPDYEAYEDDTRQMMDRSREDAAAAALRALGYAVTVENLGARVQSVLDGSPAAALLRPGDLITAVDGRPVLSSGQVVDYLRTVSPPRPVRLHVRRGEQELTVDVPAAPHPDHPGVRLGILVQSAHRVDLPVRVDIDPLQITGPSAGLTFALEILEQLTEENLARGRVVAATGAVSPDGQVGEIGSIRLKVHAAEAAGADILFVPVSQAEVAQAAARRVQVVPVATVAEALRWLRTGFAAA